MSKVSKINTSLFDSYLDKNRTKIDESLVSLRFMKEVDDFIEFNKISQRKLSDDVGYTEAYISQLMSGVKRVNTSFINKLEKQYDIKIQFKIIPNNECNYFTSFTNSFIKINVKSYLMAQVNQDYSLRNNPCEYYELNSNSITIENNG